MTTPLRFIVLFALVLACNGKSEPLPGERAFKSASYQISDSMRKDTAVGNTDSARRRAEAVAEVMTKLDRELFSGQDENKTFTRTEVFMVYCQHTTDGVAFLIHVPQFKRYKDEVRTTLVEAAWASAEAATRDLATAGPLKLGIGLRGSLQFGATAVGVHGKRPTVDLGFSVDEDPLYPFFIGAAPPEPEAPPAKPEASAEPTEPAEPVKPAKLQVRAMYAEFLAASIYDTEIRKHDAELQACAVDLKPGDKYDYSVDVTGAGAVSKLTAPDGAPESLTTCLTKLSAKWLLPKKQLKLPKPEGARIRFAFQPGPIVDNY